MSPYNLLPTEHCVTEDARSHVRADEAIPSHGEKVLPFFRMPNSAKDSFDRAFTTEVDLPRLGVCVVGENCSFR